MPRALLIIVLATAAVFAATSHAQTLAIPESIRAEGVPPVPTSLAEELNRYQNIRSASFQDWDDTGDRAMYITTRFADTPQVHYLASPRGSRRQLTFYDDRVLSVAPRPKHSQFLVEKDEGGAENFQLFLQERDGGKAQRITDGKSRDIAPVWSHSGDLLAWSSNARDGRNMDIYLASPDDLHFQRRLKDVSGQWTVADWSPDGTQVVAEEYISINESYLHVIEIATGRTTTITPRRIDPKAETVFAGHSRWAKDGKSIFYISDENSEFRRLVRYDLASGTRAPVPSSDASGDVEQFELNDDGQTIAVVVNQNGSDVVSLVENARVYSLRGFPSGQISGLKFRKGSRELGFTLSSSQQSSEAYSYDLNFAEGQRLHRWTESETGGLDTSDFAEPQLVQFPTFDGRKIPTFVYRPPAGRFPGRRPVLIDIHGGPEGQFRPSFLGRLNYLTSELGIALLMPNVRGSSGYGKSYLKLDNGILRDGAVKDIGALFDWIAQDPGLDKDRVGVSGGSYGGFMSLAVQTTYNDKIKAGIDIVGISNFVTFLKNTQGYRRDLRRVEYGDERDPTMRAYLERVSPLSSASKIHTPILIVQGHNDPRVPLSESAQLVAAVRHNDVPVWYVVGKNEGHGFARKVNQDYLQAVEVLFLRRFLLGEGS
jgi:dipeptidyl aminopeptidase/acylaminoacyl peptidase